MRRTIEWLKAVWGWLRSFPRPWRTIIVDGDIHSTQPWPTVRIESGETLIVRGNLYSHGENAAPPTNSPMVEEYRERLKHWEQALGAPAST